MTQYLQISLSTVYLSHGIGVFINVVSLTLYSENAYSPLFYSDLSAG